MDINSIIGKEAIRHSLLLRSENTKQYYLLLGIVDVVESDMQDFSADKRMVVCDRSHGSSKKNPYNLYYTEDVITVSESFLKDTENAYNVDTATIQMLSPDGLTYTDIDRHIYG